MLNGGTFADFVGRIRAGDEQAAADLVRRDEPVIRLDSMDLCQRPWPASSPGPTRRGDLTPAEQAEAEDDADRAMAALLRAVAAGYANVPLIRRDVDLDPLRSRRDFRELLMDLSFPADPFRR